MKKYYYEIYFGSPALGVEDWQNFLIAIQKYLGLTKPWQLVIRHADATLHFYVVSSMALPASINVSNFLLKPPQQTNEKDVVNPRIARPLFLKAPANLADMLGKIYKKNQEFEYLEMGFQVFPKRPFASAMIVLREGSQKVARSWLMTAPANFLKHDFSCNKNYTYQKFPKYLNTEKSLKIFSSYAEDAIFKVETFPFTCKDSWLKLNDYDFAKHSLVLGSSGMGKSKFLALFIKRLISLKDYKVVVVDPHDALWHDLADIGQQQIINFRTNKQSVDLFQSITLDIGAHVELLIGIFKELINDGYNGRLERVLRYSCYLLLTYGDFSFMSLRELLLDLDVRNRIIDETRDKTPASVQHFFLTEFSDLKNKSYDQAIAPIIAFIDEVSMVPAFNQKAKRCDLSSVVQNNFLTLFSLNRLRLGNRVVKTIASLIYQQLFLLAESKEIKQHLVVIIDEVAVVESEMLARFLSELRKYGVTVILAGQYFDQVDDNLKSAILTNVTNYYVFRTSKKDATKIAENISIKISGDDDADAVEKFITNLKRRECVMRIESQGKLLPPFLARTVEVTPLFEQAVDEDDEIMDEGAKVIVSFDFLTLDTKISSDDVMHLMSTSRKILPEK